MSYGWSGEVICTVDYIIRAIRQRLLEYDDDASGASVSRLTPAVCVLPLVNMAVIRDVCYLDPACSDRVRHGGDFGYN
jgi:hypothetical protein